MTKKSFLTLVSAIFLVLILAACGNDKNKDESENTDTGDTDTTTVPDTDPADTGDTEVVPDEDPTDSGDAEVITDEDNTDTGNVTQDGCTIKSSFGAHSVRRDLSQTCVQEIAKAKSATCDWNYKNEEETFQHIEYLQKLEITFGNECKNGDQTIECPNFIPESLKLGNLSGCDVYSADPDSDCEVQCSDLYFPTDNNVFHTVYVGATGAEIGNEAFIRSSDVIKEASFSSTLKIGSNNAIFTWSEKAEDGTETEKKVSVEMKVADSNSDTGEDFEAVDVGECRHEEPAFSFRDRIYTDGSYWCNEYVEVTDKTDSSIRFNWFGEMHCGADWEYGYKVEGIEENVLKVRILERDTDEIAVDCDNCCYLMPIEYTASTAEEIESLKGIEIKYEGKNHTAYFEIK